MSDSDRPADATDVPPPWERGTGRGLDRIEQVEPVESKTMPPSEFGKTQPIPPLTPEGVLEVVLRMHDQLLSRIDSRDSNVLTIMRDIGSQMLSHYNEQREWIRELRNRTHRQATRMQQFEIWAHEADLWMRDTQKRFDLSPPPELPVAEPPEPPEEPEE
jgi:hypothetical protein